MTLREPRGFTLIELLIVITVSVPVLMAVMSTSTLLSSTVNTNERAADVHDVLRRTTERAGQLLRPGVLSTVQVRATQADVDAGRALAIGEWIAPTEMDPRPNLRFLSAEGTVTINAGLYTSPRELEFVMDAGETDDDTDEDGDGLVDEGEVRMLYEGVTITLADRVEQFSLMLDGRVVILNMQVAVTNKQRGIMRGTIEQRFYVRNN